MSGKALYPKICVWELTLACNLRCGHCGSAAGKPRDNELSTAEGLAMIKSLAQLGGQVVTLSGGEPTLRQDWDVFSRAIRQTGMLPTLITNGIGMNDTLAGRMRRSGLMSVAVSIDGPEKVHDRIRGPGTWKRASTALKILRDAGNFTGVITTVNRLNLPYLEEIVQRVAELGVASIRFQLAKPMGALSAHRDWILAAEDLLDLLPRLNRISYAQKLSIQVGDSIGYYGPYDSRLRAESWDGTPGVWAGCQAGLTTLGVDSDGGVRGCLSLQAYRKSEHDPFLEGNLRQRPLEDIWQDPEAFGYNRNPIRPDGFCRTCRHASLCRGGARCVATTLADSWWEDPYCYHRLAENERAKPHHRVARRIVAVASAMTLAGLGCHRSTNAENDQPDAMVQDSAETKMDAGADTEGATDSTTGSWTDSETASETDTETGPCAEIHEWEIDSCCLPEPVNCAEIDCEDQTIPVPEEVYNGCCVGSPDYAWMPPVCSEIDYETLVECCPDKQGSSDAEE